MIKKNLNSGFTGNEYFKILMLIHLAMVTGLILFVFVLGLISMDPNQLNFSNPENKLYLIVVAIIVVATFILSNFIFRNGIKSLKKEVDLTVKMSRFRKLSIIRMAILESGGLISLLLFLNIKDLAFLMYTVLLILYMMTRIPAKKRTFELLDLSDEEKILINESKEIISKN